MYESANDFLKHVVSAREEVQESPKVQFVVAARTSGNDRDKIALKSDQQSQMV